MVDIAAICRSVRLSKVESTDGQAVELDVDEVSLRENQYRSGTRKMTLD